MVFLKKHFQNCRKRDRAATEQSLIRAAGELFSEKGYESTRTLEIAKAAGANEALITRYFGGKEGLLAAILKDEASMQTILKKNKTVCAVDKAFPAKEEGLSLRDSIKTFFKRGETEIESKEQFMRIASSRSFVDPEMAEVIRKRVMEHQIPSVEAAFKTHFQSKAIKKEEMEAAVMLLCANNFHLNFMGRRIFKFDQKRIDGASKLLGDALEVYFSMNAEQVAPEKEKANRKMKGK